MKELGIIIVHHDEIQHIPVVLDCLANQSYKNFKVFIVDNNSKPENKKALRELVTHYTIEIEVIWNKHNLYYTGGNNTVLKNLETHFTCVMNPDIVFEPDFLEDCIGFFFNRNHQPDVFTPKSNYYSMKNRVWYAGAKITPFDKKFSHHVGLLEKDSKQFVVIRKTDYANGACLFFKTSVIDVVGLFDEILLIYSDDMDLSLRARNAGLNVIYDGYETFYHKVKSNVLAKDKRVGVRDSRFLYYLLLRNNVIVLWKNFPFWVVVGSSLTWGLYNLVAATLLNILYRKFDLIRMHLRALVVGFMIGFRRRTHRRCGDMMLSELKYVETLKAKRTDDK